MGGKNIFRLGKTDINLDEFASNVEGLEDRIIEVLKEDWPEFRFYQYDEKMTIFPDTADLAEWDDRLLAHYDPLYTSPESICKDCPKGPCNLEKNNGKCGLELEPFQGKLSLRMACRGCMSQMKNSRELLNYALKSFGKDKSVSYGRNCFVGDLAPSIGTLTGIYVKNLADLDMALFYAESQLAKLFTASYHGMASNTRYEGMTLHAGSLLALSMDVAELVKSSCFEFITATDEPLDMLADYPPLTVLGGLGNVDRKKKVIAFAGDDFLPAWAAIGYLKKYGQEDKIEICGIGAAGNDIIRFYEKCRIVASMVNADKVIRTGFADVIVANGGCMPIDYLEATKKVETRLIWTDRVDNIGLRDRTNDPVDKIVRDLIQANDAAWIRDIERAAEVAVKVALEVERKDNYLVSDAQAREEANKCQDNCDLCFNACPFSLPVSKGVKETIKKGLVSLSEVDRACNLCGRCEEVCPANIPLIDLIVGAKGKNTQGDKFVMRPGRGPVSQVEVRQAALPLLWGNFPGFIWILGCGNVNPDDMGYMANEFLTLNCIVATAGCATAEVARFFNKDEGKFIFEEFPPESNARNLLNCGSCTALAHCMDESMKIARLIGNISQYGNLACTADFHHGHCQFAFIIWGGLPERMYAMAASIARNGQPVIVGPISGFEWKRYLLGNKYDRSSWQVYDGITGRKREYEPAPKHLIIPVETKEEAVTLANGLLYRWADTREQRAGINTAYIGAHEKHFKELPDDWHLYVRSDAELPWKEKVRLLKELEDKHGWEVDRIRIKSVLNRDGKRVTLEEFSHEYGIESGWHATWIPRFVKTEGRQTAEELDKGS
ncbi:MAG: hypothetical protein SV375_05105 [Thermodesulfobacteriota bacterium]|nr:hypothetical protein [Thermodesulfobacteriota bacterium]